MPLPEDPKQHGDLFVTVTTAKKPEPGNPSTGRPLDLNT